MREMVVAAIQMASELGQAKLNAAYMCRWLERARVSGAQMVFFPECSLTGYSTAQASEIAIAADDEAIALLEYHASMLGVAVGYGFVERDAAVELPYVTYVVAYGEDRLVYRKSHLGASEQPYFSQGNELPVADIAGVCIGVQLCWEGHIPDIAATLRARGAELLLTPHAGGLGGTRRVDSWCRYLPARAQDNGMYILACNALWPEGYQSSSMTERGGHGGGLIAFAPDGSLLESYDGDDEHMLALRIGGILPREMKSGGMMNISFFDRRRPELYER
ncbi:MAG: hypothetical protein J5804_02450 [Eggerthellaceae bacterium]|nr:hypothetical protein [Eggerthellaceae bacterium]